jgi:putative tricarboxylic transport membrane protein
MKHLDEIAALFLTLVGVATLMVATQYKLFKGKILGAGFFPFAAGVVLVALSLYVFFSAVHARRENSEKTTGKTFFPEPSGWKKLTIALSALLVYGLVLERLGYLITTFLFLIFLMRSIKPQKWIVTMIIAFAATASSYVLFDLWLKVRLPIGILGI